MDKMELRKVLLNTPKKELEKLIGSFNSNCPHFNLKINYSTIKQELLASKLWAILMNLKETYPDEDFPVCIKILSEEKDKPNETENISKTSKEVFRIIPFSPNSICKHLYELISTDKKLMEKWRKDRKYHGFTSFIASNDICIPPGLEKLLYDNLFDEENDDTDDAILINYARYQLDMYEEDFKSFFSKLSDEEIDIVLSLHLLFKWIISLLEIRKEKINYKYDDLPILKRVILAQYLKLKSDNKCDKTMDEELDEIADIINELVYERMVDLNIKIIPWGDLD